MQNSTPVAEVLLVRDAEGVRHLTLNRPQSLNAFSLDLFDAVRGALQEAAEDPAIRCVALTGAGRAFTAGSDLSGDGAEPDPRAVDPYEAFIARVETFPKPLVVAVNGLAVGIGTTLLGHADLALAGASARFRAPFTSLGLVPEAGSTVTLPALMGRWASTHLLLTSQWLSAQDAAAAGLLWKVVPDEELEAATAEVCAQLAAQPLESLVATKQLLLDARLPAARAAREREERTFRRMLTEPAHLAALAAFRERA
jgi:enoyl-CoA hydratase/carnithine racemase